MKLGVFAMCYVVRGTNEPEDRRRTWVLFYGGKESSAVECGLVEPFFSTNDSTSYINSTKLDHILHDSRISRYRVDMVCT